MSNKSENLPMTTCPGCGEDVELCDDCGVILHEDAARGTNGEWVLCDYCLRKWKGLCARRRLERVKALGTREAQATPEGGQLPSIRVGSD